MPSYDWLISDWSSDVCFSYLAREARGRQVEAFCESFDAKATAVLRAVIGSCGEMRQVAQQMSSIAEQTASQAKLVTGAAEEASSNVQTAASGAEELSSSIGQIARQVEIGRASCRERGGQYVYISVGGDSL